MAAGDKVVFPFVSDFATIFNSRNFGTLPIIGTVVEAFGEAAESTIVWPGGAKVTVPDETVNKVFDRASFGNPNAESWFDDVGRYVQITDWPFPGAAAFLRAAGAETPPKSPAASGLVSMVFGIGDLNDVAPEFVVAFIAVQNGLKHMYVLSSPDTGNFAKPYIEQPGRRAVGYK